MIKSILAIQYNSLEAIDVPKLSVYEQNIMMEVVEILTTLKKLLTSHMWKITHLRMYPSLCQEFRASVKTRW